MPQCSLIPRDFLVLDVETRHSAQEAGGWSALDRMGVSVAVLYDSRSDAFTSYGQEDIPELAERLSSGPLVVGFNTIRFDYPVLAPHAPACDFKKLPSLDMLAKIYATLGYRVSLDNLGEATLGVGKSADGAAALRWWKERRLDLIEAYCRQDVALTRNLYLFGRENGYLLHTGKTAGRVVRVPVEWS